MPLTMPTPLTALEEGVTVTTRTKINFVGTNVTVTEDAVNDRILVTIVSGAGGGDFMADGSVPLTGDIDFAALYQCHDLQAPAAAGEAIRQTAKITEVALEDAVDKKHATGGDIALGAVGAKNPPIDADKSLFRDSTASDALVTATWAQVKAFLKTYFDTLYNLYVHPNHSGEVTSVADGAQTIANDAVTYAKMQNVSATDKVLGRFTAGAGDVEEIACTAAGRALLDDADAAAQWATLVGDTKAVAAVNAAGVLYATGKGMNYTTPTGDHTASGIIKTKTAGASLVFGDACYIGTDNKMEKALGDDAAVTIPATYLCLETIAENATGLFLEQGEAYDASWAFDIGLSVYLSAATAGLITKTMPTKVTGNQVQVLGTAIAADKIFWNPSMVVMEYA